MEKVIKFITIIVILLIGFTFISCSKTASASATSDETANTSTVTAASTTTTTTAAVTTANAAVSGTYEGILPCADCSGLKTVITFNSNGTFHMEETYLDTDVPSRITEGSWVLKEDLITFTSGTYNFTYKLISENEIRWAPDGKEITGTNINWSLLKTTTAQVSAAPEIIFSSLDNDTGKIYICSPDGSTLQEILEPGINTSPSWNSVHSKFVFTSLDTASGISGLYIYDMQKKDKTLLLKRFSPRDPSFSPDGNTIVFADFVEDGSENAEIYTISIDGSNLTKLTDNPARDYFPKYSYDGKTIVFSSERNGNIQLYTMDSSGSNVKRLMEDKFTDNVASFSPDGSKIIFNSDRGGNSDIYTISPDGSGEAKNITNNSAGNYEACYSLDGSMIAFRSNKGLEDDMSYDIFVMGADGSNQIDITPVLTNTNEFNPSW